MKSKSQARSIPLTKQQFKALMKAVYLGNWMANAWRTKNQKKEYEGIESYIFSLAPKFGLDQYVDHEESDGKRYYPTGLFEAETDVDKLHEEYDEETFWDELADRLGERDFFEKHTKEEIEKMSKNKWFTKLYERIDAISRELNRHGLERLRVVKKQDRGTTNDHE